MLNPVKEGGEDWSDSLLSSLENFWKFLVFLSSDAHVCRLLHKIHVFFSFFFVSCWNIRFGAICHFRPTNSASSGENLRNRFHLFCQLWIFKTIFLPPFSRFQKRSPSIPIISLSASLSSPRKLIKYSKPNAVWAHRNAFMRNFPNFVEIYPVCQPSAVLPGISLISLSIGSYLELAIFREDFSSVGSVNVWFSWVFYFVFFSCYKLYSPHCVMGAVPGLFSLGTFPTFGSHDFRHGCLYVESSEGGRGRLKRFVTVVAWKFLKISCFVLSVSCWNIWFGAISNFRPTNSASSRENLRNRVLLIHYLWIFETIFSLFLGRFRQFWIPVISEHRCVQSGS